MISKFQLENILYMNKRLHPFRKNPPCWLQNLLYNLPKFYLVGITGHTSFILQDLKNFKYKITIGNQIKCSCSNKLSDHCVHTLFILSDVFYIEPKDPLMWQIQYLNSELRYMIANRRIRLNKISDFLKYIKPRNFNNRIKNSEDSDDENDNLCAICEEQILKTDAITSCTKICSNSFHLNCFKQWAQHQISVGGRITCPICRDKKQDEIILDLRKKECELLEQQINRKIGVQFADYCEGCSLKEIEPDINVYRCLVCQDFVLCEHCFQNGKHIQHSFIMKSGGSKKWTYAEDRKLKKKLDQQQCLIRIKLTPSKFYNFLACTIPCYFSKNTRWNIIECKKLDIKIEDLECIMCEDKQRAFLRRLYCGHFIHHKCLKKRIEKNKFFCKIDGMRFLLGYQALIKKEKLDKIMEQDNNQDSIEQQGYYESKKSIQKLKLKYPMEKQNEGMNERRLSSTMKYSYKQNNVLNRSINI